MSKLLTRNPAVASLVVPLIVASVLAACSGSSESTTRAGSELSPSPAAAVPSAGRDSDTVISTATPATGTALERSGDRVRGLVDVGGYRLYLECIGSGEPTVVLEAGFSGGASVWSLVQPAVAETTRVCAYDRANRGMSDRRPAPLSAAEMVADLHALLAAAQVPGPYVLVGQSYGGAVSQLYAAMYPAEVVGMVLVDSVHPETMATERDAVLRDVDFHATGAQLLAAGPPPPLPLVVLARGLRTSQRGETPEQWQAWQADLAARVPGAKLVVVADAGHNIHRERPEVVIEAIREVVAAVRGR